MDAIGPIFVAGCPRSGTSALSWAIAAHDSYWTSVETHFFYYLLRQNWVGNAFASSGGSGSWLDQHAMPLDEFLAHLGSGLDRLMRSRSGGREWVDGSPENVLVAPLLLRMYPRAHLFHAVRDPLAVCFSMLTSGFAEPWASDLEQAIRTWKYYVSAGLQLMEDFPGRVTIIRQEDMRTQPEEVATRIGKTLGLDAVGAVAGFLARETINSSANKRSYAELSPFRNKATPQLDPAEFQALHGAMIRAETAPLAAQCGYA